MQANGEPGKEAARAYLAQRLLERTPPPPQSEVRRRVGWATVAPSRPADARVDGKPIAGVSR